MKAIIVGGGTVGMNLAIALEKQNVNVTIVEKEENVCEDLASKTNATIIEGNAIEPKLMDTLNLMNCDLFYAVTPFDPVNFLCAMYAKKSLAKRVFAKINEPGICSMLNKLGIETTIPAAAISYELINISLSTDLTNLLNPAKSKLFIYEVKIPKDKEFPLISEIEEKKGVDIFALYDGNKYHIPDDFHQLAGMKSAIVIAKKRIDNLF